MTAILAIPTLLKQARILLYLLPGRQQLEILQIMVSFSNRPCSRHFGVKIVPETFAEIGHEWALPECLLALVCDGQTKFRIS